MSYWQSLHTLLQEYAEKRHPKSYLEIGVREGDSLLALFNGWVPERVTLCDDWGTAAGGTGHGSHAHIETLLETLKTKPLRYPITTNPTYMDGNSHEIIKALGEKFEFITVDGDHSKEGATQDLDDAWPLLEVGGLIFFDDIFHPAHPYLIDVLREFEAKHLADALVIRVDHAVRDEPGCALIEKTQ